MKKLLLLFAFSCSSIFSVVEVNNNITTEQEKIQLERERILMDQNVRKMEYSIKMKSGQLILKKIEKDLDKENKRLTKSIYTHAPINNKIITVSDRSIEMPISIKQSTANEIEKKINYFNRQNNYPIFLVIDICYGGSVLAGERIMKAIKASQAKVYIVVKSYAASMAAIIVSTFAENSYVFKNALILHHEISNSADGNRSNHEHNSEYLDKWQQLLFAPLAARKNISIESFIDSLYKIKRDGDAILFAPEAVKEKWIINIIDGMKDESFQEEPKRSLINITVSQEPQEEKNPNDIMYMKRK